MHLPRFSKHLRQYGLQVKKLIGKEKEVSFITNEAMNGRVEFKKALLDRVAILKGNPTDILETLKKMSLKILVQVLIIGKI